MGMAEEETEVLSLRATLTKLARIGIDNVIKGLTEEIESRFSAFFRIVDTLYSEKWAGSVEEKVDAANKVIDRGIEKLPLDEIKETNIKWRDAARILYRLTAIDEQLEDETRAYARKNAKLYKNRVPDLNKAYDLRIAVVRYRAGYLTTNDLQRKVTGPLRDKLAQELENLARPADAHYTPAAESEILEKSEQTATKEVNLVDTSVNAITAQLKPTRAINDPELIEFARRGLEINCRLCLRGPIGQSSNELVEGIANSAIRGDLMRLAREYKMIDLLKFLQDGSEDKPSGFPSSVIMHPLIPKVTNLSIDDWIISLDGSRPDRFILDVADFLFTRLIDGENEVWKFSVDELLQTFRLEFIEDDLVPTPVTLVNDLSNSTQLAEFLNYLRPQRLISTTHHSLSEEISIALQPLSHDEVCALLTNELEQAELINATESMIPWLEGNHLAVAWINTFLRHSREEVASKIEFINQCTTTAEDLGFRPSTVQDGAPSVPISLRAIGHEVIREFHKVSGVWQIAEDDIESLLATLCCIYPYGLSDTLLVDLIRSCLQYDSDFQFNVEVLKEFGILQEYTPWCADPFLYVEPELYFIPGIMDTFRSIIRPRTLHKAATSVLEYVRSGLQERLKTPIDRDRWLENSIWLRHCFEAYEVMNSLSRSPKNAYIDRSVLVNKLAPPWSDY